MSKEKGDTVKKPSFQFYPADLMTDPLVMSLGNEFAGGYVKLLCYDWLDDGIVDDNDEIWGLTGFALRHRNKRKWLERLRLKFGKHPTKEGFLTNPRLQYEREKQAEFAKKRSEAGSKGAEKRWSSDGGANSKAIASSIAKNSSSSSSSSSSSKEKEIISKGDSEKKELEYTVEDLNLALVFRKDILDFKPDFYFGKSEEEFAHDIQFIRRSKKKDINQILELWTWARQSEFWRTVILAPSALNKNWGMLEVQRDAKPSEEDSDIDAWANQKKKEQKEKAEAKAIADNAEATKKAREQAK